MTKQRNPAVPWPTLGDFYCGSDAEMSSKQEGKHSSVAGHSPSNPQAPKSATPRNASAAAPWGPTHSYNTDDEDFSNIRRQQQHQKNANNNSSRDGAATPGGGSGSGSSSGHRTNPNQGGDEHEADCGGAGGAKPSMERIWERAGSLRRKIMTSELSFGEFGDTCFEATSFSISPCTAGFVSSLGRSTSATSTGLDKEYDSKNIQATSMFPVPPILGISRMRPPSDDLANAKRVARKKELAAMTSMRPIREHEEIEVLPNHKVQVRLPPTDHLIGDIAGTGKNRRKAPVATLEVNSDMAELERSISELTMRSSYAAGSESLNKIPDNRRMAYYAVGKHHRQSGRGGNRRCYFTGKLILGGAPFYAGSVQQGLRTLVVFCLPSALGLPEKDAMMKGKQNSNSLLSAVMGSVVPTSMSVASGSSPVPSPSALAALHHPPTREQSRASSKNSSIVFDYQNRLGSAPRGGASSSGMGSHKRYYNGAASVASKSMSRLSSLDDLSLSIDGDLDPNWGLDRDYLLSVLPEASGDLLKEMSRIYPEQFETLPVQVRDAKKWKLYVKFCFFSGLPIAEGEMHYKVRDEIADQVYGEEIILSHEVMEAVNGESAEMLTLPNQKAFRYLRKHYAQQCSKLDERVFRRNCWERVAPEV